MEENLQIPQPEEVKSVENEGTQEVKEVQTIEENPVMDNAKAETEQALEKQTVQEAPKKRRGRKKKTETQKAAEEKTTVKTGQKRRGRPPKSQKTDNEQAAKKTYSKKVQKSSGILHISIGDELPRYLL